MYILLNGSLVNKERVLISAVGEGFTYGYGLFETIKIKNGQCIYLKEHWNRLREGCKILHIPFAHDFSKIQSDISTLMKANGLENGSVKISYTKNQDHNDILITTAVNKYTEDKYESGYHICLATVRKSPHSRLVYLKSNNYLENILEREQANLNGFQEAIFLNTYDKICEGTYTNLFFVKNNVVYTPSVSCGILPGIMREKVIELLSKSLIKLKIGEFTEKELMDSDEIFLTNSLMEIMPVSRFGEREYSLEHNKITRHMQRDLLIAPARG